MTKQRDLSVSRRRYLRALGAASMVGVGAESVETAAAEAGDELWSFQTRGPVNSSPAVADGTVYVGSTDRNVYALSADDGSEQWTFQTGDRVRSSPAVVDGTVYVGSFDRNVYALSAEDGSEQWSYETRNKVWGSPAVVDGTVYVGSEDGNVYALSAADGTEQWSFQTGDSVLSLPAVVNGTVYIGTGDDNNVYALSAADGTEQWSFQTGDWVRSSPAVVDGTVYVGSDDNNVYALSAEEGTEQWSFQTGDKVRSSPAVVDNTVYVGSFDSNVYALSAEDGSEKWTFKTGEGVLSSPAVVNNTVYVGSVDSNLYALSAEDGSEHWSYQTGARVFSSPTVVNNTVYVGSVDSNVYALTADNSDSPGDTGPGTGVTFDDAVEYKLSTATELDDTAVTLSEKADAEQVISQLRTDLDAGEFDSSSLPTEAVQRLQLGEQLATRLVARTSDKTIDVIINETQIAVEMTEFAVNLGVSLVLSQLSLTEALVGTRFSSLTPDSDWVANNLDGAITELVTMFFPAQMVSDAFSEITGAATEAYQRLTDGQFADADQFTDYLSDTIAATIANLSIQRTIETGGGVNPLRGVNQLAVSVLDANVNVEKSLDRLNDAMSSSTLQADGLDGTEANAEDVTSTAGSAIDDVAGVTQTFLTELQNNVEYIGIAENAYQLIDGVSNGELELWEAAGLIGALVPKSGLAVATVRAIGVYVGRFIIRLLMTTTAVGTLGIQRGENVNLDRVDEFLPDVETVLSEIDAVGNRWEDVA